MREIVRINLDNEMDLILAHKRSMKIAELCGLTLSSQTSFATAVSEIARCSITYGKGSYLMLGILFGRGGNKEIMAILFDEMDLFKMNPAAFSYAEKLSGNLNYGKDNGLYTVTLSHKVPFSGTISDKKIMDFVAYFKQETPLSPYDEIRKKNIQLIELAEKLGVSENNYRQLTDTLPQLVFSVSEDGTITFTNKWLKDYLDVPFQFFDKATLDRIMFNGDSKAIVQDWEKARKTKSRLVGQARIKHKNDYVWHLISIVPQKNDHEGRINWIGFFVDIHAQKMIEETLKDNKELRQAQKKLLANQQLLEEKNMELSKKNNDLEQFAYIASHDLQEPLRKIRTFTSFADRYFTAEQKQGIYLTKINGAVDRMSTLITDILNYSRLTAASQKLLPVDLNIILKEVINDFEIVVEEKNATIKYSQLPKIKGIPVQINQLFYNLISNSLKFTHDTPLIEITADVVSGGNDPLLNLDPNSSFHKIVFTDNGIGIDEQYSEKIFTIFQRLHQRSDFEGTGIGLALCKKITENHHGAISFHSKLGHGTSFEVYLPV